MKTNLLNDPLRKQLFLKKDKNIYNSKINLFGALSDSSIYFRRKVKITGSAYLVGIRALIESRLKEVNLSDLLNTYNYYLNLRTPLYSFKRTLKNWLIKDRIPLEFIRVLSITLFDNFKVQKDFLIKIFLKMNYITDRAGMSKFNPPILLKDVLSPRRIYDVGVSMGDGRLFGRHQHIADGSVNGEDLNLTKFYLEKLKKLKKEIWGLSDKSITILKGKKRNRNMYKLAVQNKFYVKYLNFVYDLPIGNKIKQNLKEPEIINFTKKLEINLLKSFLYRGLFDTDGHYSKGSSKASFWSESQTLIKQTKNFLEINDIGFTSTDREININAESYRKFLERVGCSHARKLKTISNRLSIQPKAYFLKGINKDRLINGYFNFEELNCHIKGIGSIFKEFREKLGWTQTKYSKEFNIDVVTIRHWECGLNGIPFKELCRVIRLNKLDLYKELNKRLSHLDIGGIKLPFKPSQKMLETVNFIIPQKSFNHACVIKRESTSMGKNQINNLIENIERLFHCKIKENKSTGALYIYNSYLTKFLDTFFIYKKSWSTMNNSEIKDFQNNMINILEGDMKCELPFEMEKRKEIIKKEAETNATFGCKPDERPIEQLIQYGVINLNKPAGPS